MMKISIRCGAYPLLMSTQPYLRFSSLAARRNTGQEIITPPFGFNVGTYSHVIAGMTFRIRGVPLG